MLVDRPLDHEGEQCPMPDCEGKLVSLLNGVDYFCPACRESFETDELRAGHHKVKGSIQPSSATSPIVSRGGK